MTDRLPLAQHTKASLDALYAETDRLTAELRQYTEADSADAAAGSYALRAERAEARLARASDLCERWVKAGPPPLGVLLARWWDARLVELRDAIRPAAEQSPRTTPDNPATSSNSEDAAPELTAEEARDLADELGNDLYRAQDALAFVEECCDILDREGRQPTTAMVREWLKGARCGRELAADPSGTPATAMARWLLEGARDLDIPADTEADDLTGAWTPDPPIGCLSLTGPLTGIEVRDPCPWCESSPSLIPRALMDEHVATVHPEVKTGGPGIPVPDAEPWAEGGRLAQSGVDTPGCDCGHQGMGISWHGDDCPWRCGLLDIRRERTPSQCPGLRDQLADATVPLLLDTLPKVIARARGYEVADAVLTLLYREWPWLRAESEEGGQLHATLAAITAEAARRGVISIDGIRNIVRQQEQLATPPVPRDPCPYCESSSERVPRHLMDDHVATVHPEQQR